MLFLVPSGASQRFLSRITSLILVGMLFNCASENPGDPPVLNRFYFPTATVLAPDRPVLYVTNSNADLRYNGGTLFPMDLSAWPVNPAEIGAKKNADKLKCRRDPDDPSRWLCPEDHLIKTETAVRIGAYPSGLEISRDGKNLFAPVRGDNVITWTEVVRLKDGSIDLRCNNSTTEESCRNTGTDRNCTIATCDDSHSVLFSGSLNRNLPTEPFGMLVNETVATHIDATGHRRTCLDGQSTVACDCGIEPRCDTNDFNPRNCCLEQSLGTEIFLSHLSTGEVSLLSFKNKRLAFEDVLTVFPPAQSTIGGAVSLTSLVPGDAATPLLVASRTDNRLKTVTPTLTEKLPKLNLGRELLVQPITPATDVRGVYFDAAKQTLFATSRQPPSLLAFNLTVRENGQLTLNPRFTVEVCPEPSMIKANPTLNQLYVVCFSSAELWVIDTTRGELVGQVTTGLGPSSITVDTTRQELFVTNFLENTIGVIDLNPTRTTYLRMFARFGTPCLLAEQESKRCLP